MAKQGHADHSPNYPLHGQATPAQGDGSGLLQAMADKIGREKVIQPFEFGWRTVMEEIESLSDAHKKSDTNQ